MEGNNNALSTQFFAELDTPHQITFETPFGVLNFLFRPHTGFSKLGVLTCKLPEGTDATELVGFYRGQGKEYFRCVICRQGLAQWIGIFGTLTKTRFACCECVGLIRNSSVPRVCVSGRDVRACGSELFEFDQQVVQCACCKITAAKRRNPVALTARCVAERIWRSVRGLIRRGFLTPTPSIRRFLVRWLIYGMLDTAALFRENAEEMQKGVRGRVAVEDTLYLAYYLIRAIDTVLRAL